MPKAPTSHRVHQSVRGQVKLGLELRQHLLVDDVDLRATSPKAACDIMVDTWALKGGIHAAKNSQ